MLRKLFWVSLLNSCEINGPADNDDDILLTRHIIDIIYEMSVYDDERKRVCVINMISDLYIKEKDDEYWANFIFLSSGD